MNARNDASKPTDADTIAALTAQCAQLAASLKQTETEADEAVAGACGERDDCAGQMKCYADWHLALFQAIAHYTDDGKYGNAPLDAGQRLTVAQLAGLGVYLADHAHSSASGFLVQAEGAAT